MDSPAKRLWVSERSVWAELSFGYRLHELYPSDEIYLVKLGITATSLAGDWNPAYGSVYNLFRSRVNAAMNNLTQLGKNPRSTA